MSWEENALLSHRIIFLGGRINNDLANRVIAQLLLLDAADPQKSIDVYINSSGGSVPDGLAIIDTIKCIRAPVSTICIGQAASMAAWILAAGRKGERYATPNAEIMIHQLSTALEGRSEDFRVYADYITRHQESLIQLFSQWTGQPVEKIKQDISHDYFMSAQQAKEYGIIDKILEPPVR